MIDWSQVPKQFLIWAFICCVSAAPSFMFGGALHSEPRHIAAMVCGIALFVVAYTLVASTWHVDRLRRSNKALRVTLYVGYGTRLALSAAFPITIMVDGIIGMVSTTITAGIVLGEFDGNRYYAMREQLGFFSVLFTTIVQGTLLNIALAIYMAVVYGGTRLFVRSRPPEGQCTECGYDLRGSPGPHCPECGHFIHGDDAPLVTIDDGV